MFICANCDGVLVRERQSLSGMVQTMGFAGVSFLAHIGGAGVGFIFWCLFRNR